MNIMIKTESQLNSRNKFTIIAGFLIVLILLGSLMVIAITQILDNEQRINIVNYELSEISNSYNMRDAANNRVLLLYRMAQTNDDFHRDDMYMEFRNFGGIFIDSFNKIKATLESKDEKNKYKHSSKIREVFELAKISIRKGGKTQTIAAVDLIEGRIIKAHENLENKIIPLQKDVKQSLTKLSESFQQSADNKLISISEQNKFSILLISIIGSIAIILGLIITFYITRRVIKSENAFIKQRELAEHANQAKSMFLATMSHEIRSPLAAIIGFSDLVRKGKLSPKKLDSSIEAINRNGQHLLQLINDILDITKIEAGQLDIELISISPFHILSEFQSVVAVDAKNSNLDFTINYDFPLPKMIQTDPIRLKQILFNLTSNAIKFTKNGGISLNVHYDQNTETMTFSITDSGIGLTLAQQEKIFDSFSQADSSTTRRYGGSGLGLNICRILSEKLGGHISVESTPNIGSKFSFCINTGKVNDESMVYSLNHQKQEHQNHHFKPTTKLYGHILLAEDIVDNQNLIEMYVTNTGAKITIVNNGAEAVEICKTQEFDLILMDMQMPVMDGIEATKQIRLSDNKTPIISLTANAMKSDFEKCIDAGATEFLTKPIDTTRFNQTLYRYLSNVTNSTITKTASKDKPNKLKKLTEKFIKALPERLSLINKLFDEQSWTKLEDESHKLKGIGSPFGFPEITNICGKINLACRDEKFDEISELVEELNEFCTPIFN